MQLTWSPLGFKARAAPEQLQIGPLRFNACRTVSSTLLRTARAALGLSRAGRSDNLTEWGLDTDRQRRARDVAETKLKNQTQTHKGRACKQSVCLATFLQLHIPWPMHSGLIPTHHLHQQHHLGHHKIAGAGTCRNSDRLGPRTHV